jgi:GT2 family glycosyltransferase
MAEESTASLSHAKPYALEAAARAVLEHLARTKVTAIVEPHREIYLRIRYPAPKDAPLVSMIIPTRDRADLLRKMVNSVFAKTDYKNYELVIVDNESSEAAALDYLDGLRKDRRAQIHRVPGSFNYSKLNNLGVSKARGNVIALMNNDLEAINPDWLKEMLSHLMRPEIGAVGARLWYPDGTLQHAGVILGSGGVAGHIHGGKRPDSGYFSRQHLAQNFSAVTAACMLVRKEVYQEVNGLDEINLPVAFGDVDFCLRLRRAGYRIVWTPHAEFFHHESASRGVEDTSDKQRRFLSEIEYMRETWGDLLVTDPYYNPNLSLDSDLFTLAFPPRLKKPWETDES